MYFYFFTLSHLKEHPTLKLKLRMQSLGLPDTLHFTYLDVKGHSIVEIAASKNLVDNHIQPFKVL
jgi:hypothetical protein